MQSDPTWGAQFAVQRLANQRVHEGKSTIAFARLADELCSRCLLQGVEQLVLCEIRGRFEHRDVKLATNDGRDAERPIAGLAQPRQSSPDDFFDALRQAEIGALDGRQRRSANPGDRPRLLQVSEHL